MGENNLPMTLYTCCLRYDDGAAPNPYWGICTLAICKPAIRRKASEGDWVVGLGSKRSPCGDVSSKVVYAMHVTQVLSMKDYDLYCRKSLRKKIPDWRSVDFRKRMGDCIYDFRGPRPQLRESVHRAGNRKTDLSGRNVLLSDYFYYFGNNPVELPNDLRALIHGTRGHKSGANDRYARRFVQWIESEGFRKNVLLGQPQLKKKLAVENPSACRQLCSKRHFEISHRD
jgi:hypothetical protein